LEAIERSAPVNGQPPDLTAALHAGRDTLQEVQYDCLGCEVCYPAIAINELGVEETACPAEQVEERYGWPPYAGEYTVVKYNAPVAVCTLTDDALIRSLIEKQTSGLSIVGTLQTENLGIERVILNTLANPNIRFLILCGPDSRQQVGHLPGQSLASLARNGVDERMRIKDANGKRPRLRNLSSDAIEHFRNTVEVIDLIDESAISLIQEKIGECESKNPGPAAAFSSSPKVKTERGYLPSRMVADPAGYFVLYVDRRRSLLSLEHYSNDGVLDVVIEGPTAAQVYTASIDKHLLSRLDHAAYLGRELARAEHALRTERQYIQDSAPEQPQSMDQSVCGCRPLNQETVS
jgi:tetrahydromethanopterin S-methyltransferase subunit A